MFTRTTIRLLTLPYFRTYKSLERLDASYVMLSLVLIRAREQIMDVSNIVMIQQGNAYVIHISATTYHTLNIYIL